MLKVVGASWFQTRISTYILVAVVLLGFGAILLGQFEKVKNDGIYSATILWNHKGGFKTEFWGQGNNLTSIPSGAARGYYKTKIDETGWSYIEIETSSSYPDGVQAYAAGMLEGSLTWQLIYHHWFNTIKSVCIKYDSICEKIRNRLAINNKLIQERAKEKSSNDSFWHMVRLFYIQLEGLESGWRYGVRLSLNDYDIPKEDFLWMIAASNFLHFRSINQHNNGAIFIQNLITQQDSELGSLLAIIHATSAPYFKMLRLIKKYTFGFHLFNRRDSDRLPTRSIVFSSYPGALSSQDEYYILYGEKKEDVMIVTGIPMTEESNKSDKLNEKEEKDTDPIVLTAPKIMATNWLSSNGKYWSNLLQRSDLQKTSSIFFTPFQWIITNYLNNLTNIWLVEQYPTMTLSMKFTQILKYKDNILCNGMPLINRKIKSIDYKSSNNPMALNINNNSDSENFNLNIIKTIHEFDKIFNFRGDLDVKPAIIDGIIDIKMSIINSKGLIKFEAKSGPPITDDKLPFEWSKSFPNIHHTGQPNQFNFDITSPKWVWF